MTKNEKNLDYALTRLELCKPCVVSIDWCCECVDWLWKWRKITPEAKDYYCERIIAYFERSNSYGT